MNDEALRRVVTTLLETLGDDPDREGLQDTPRRVAELFAELYRGVGIDPVTVLEAASVLDSPDDAHGDLVALTGIAFTSVCEHHLLPFRGTAHVVYQPIDRVVGLGVLADLVQLSAARPQMQERLGDMIADALVRSGIAEGSLVVLRAEHGCLAHRGPKLAGSETVTVASAGSLKEPLAKHDALLLVGTKV